MIKAILVIIVMVVFYLSGRAIHCARGIFNDDPARHAAADSFGVHPRDLVYLGGRWLPKRAKKYRAR